MHPTLATAARRAGVLVLAAALLSACSANEPDKVTAAATRPPVLATGEPSPEPGPTLESPSPSPIATTAAPAPTKAAAKPAAKRPRPVPSRKVATPPPPPPPIKVKPVHNPGPPPCTKKTGTDAPKAAVRDSLTAAANREYWTKTKGIVVPVSLIKAIAWQESGWQSGILACDGGIGTMQIMPATATWMNNRFGSKFDVSTLDGNTQLGAEYLAWEIRYFGDLYYSDKTLFPNPYDVMNNAWMLDAVIAGYNYGVEKIDPSKEAAGIPNPRYVTPVKALMTNCVCLKY